MSLTEKEIQYFKEQLPSNLVAVDLSEITDVWAFVEKYYPNYSSCDLIAQSDDYEKILNNEHHDSHSCEEIIKNTDFKCIDHLHRIIINRRARVNEIILIESIKEFINQTKK